MRRIWFLLSLMIAFALMFTPQLTFSEGTIGFTYNRVVEDSNIGFTGDYEYSADRFTVDVGGNLQSGDVYKGKVDTAITFDVSAVGVRLYSNNALKGYTLNTLGRSNDVGAALVVPIQDDEVAVGIFGRNGNPFAPRSALGTLTDAGFAEEQFDGLGLADITLAEGISIKEGSSLNASLETELHISRFEVELKGLLELAGEGERVHQLLANISTDGNLFGHVSWQVSGDLAAQLYGEIVEWETGIMVSTLYKFR